MRFIHTADWHLGRIFHGVSLVEDQAFALDRLLEVIEDFRPQVLAVAGDVYDRATPPADAVRLLDDFLARVILDHKIAVLMIAGNHDGPDRLGFGARLFAGQGLRIEGPLAREHEPLVLEDQWGPVEFHALPYAEPAVARERLGDASIETHGAVMRALTDRARRRRAPGRRAVLVAHAFAAGGGASDSERPLFVGGSGAADPAVFEGFNYTALGHLHRPQCIAPASGERPGGQANGASSCANEPYAASTVSELKFELQTTDKRLRCQDAPDLFAAVFPPSDSPTYNSSSGDSPAGAMTAPIQYSGSLLKYSFAEAGHKKSLTCVELDASGGIRAARRSIAPRRDVRRVEGKLLEILAAAERDARREDYIMASLLDDGPILDAMGRLREAYPNCLHLERPALQAAAETGAWAGGAGAAGGQRRMADLELFERFFEQMTGGAISGEQRKALSETIAEARRAEREASA